MTDGERLTAILVQYAIPCEKVSFHGNLDALSATYKRSRATKST